MTRCTMECSLFSEFSVYECKSQLHENSCLCILTRRKHCIPGRVLHAHIIIKRLQFLKLCDCYARHLAIMHEKEPVSRFVLLRHASLRALLPCACVFVARKLA